MTEAHDARHEALLASVLTGELDREDPAAGELRACPTCRDEIERLHATTALLDAAGAERRTILADAVDPGAAAPRGPRRGTQRTPWTWLAAAALLAVALLLWSMRRCGEEPGAGPDLDMLLRGRVEVPGFEPSGEVRRDAAFPFSWTAAEASDYLVYRVEVHELRADGSRSPEPVAASKVLQANEWTPEPPERARVLACPAIEWRVSVRDATGGGWEPLPAIAVVWR